MKRDYMTGFYLIFSVLSPSKDSYLLLFLFSPLTLSYSPVLPFLSLFFFLASIARWMRKNDCDISHRFHINASGSNAGQAHWFLFGMSQENTKNWGPHKFEKWNSLPLNWLTCFSGLWFPREEVGGQCICIGKGLLVNYIRIYKLVLKSMELRVCSFLLLLLLLKNDRKSPTTQYYPKMAATSRQKPFYICWYN